MDAMVLKLACESECRNAFEDFKHNLHNTPFVSPINEGYISDCLNMMRESIQIAKRVINASPVLTEAQMGVMFKEINTHVNITMAVAGRYGKKRLYNQGSINL